MATSDRSLGGFSADAVTPSGLNTYYQIINPAATAQPNADVAISKYAIGDDALLASSTEPYYALTGAALPNGNRLSEAPYQFPVPDPLLNLTNSKVMGVGPYGTCSIPLSGNAAFGVGAVQYGEAASYFVAGNFPNINPPTGPPTVPSLAAPTTADAIPIIFDTAGIAGTEPISYLFSYGTTPTPDGSWITDATLPVIGNPTQRTAVAGGLTASTTYYFVSIAQNQGGREVSAVSPPYTTQPGTPGAPSAPPTTPIKVASSPTSITIQFDTAGITGNPVPGYFCKFGTTNTPSANAPLPSVYQGTLYRCVLTNLASGVGYYFTAGAENGKLPDQISAVAGPFTTASSNAPSKPPTAPVVSGITPPTASDITITCDITGITGTPTPTYVAQYGLTPTTITSLGGTMTVSGNTASITVGSLTANTIYYFNATATNGVTPDQVSPASAPISTTGSGKTPPSGPPTVPVVSTPAPTPTTLTVQFDVAGITGTPTPIYRLLIGTTTSPQEEVTVELSSGTIYKGTATGLTPATNYYWKSVAFNGQAPDALSAVSAPISTAASGGTPPNQPPTVPAVFGAPTDTSITLQFDTTGITGNPPPAFGVLWGLNPSPGSMVPATIVGSGPIYQATVTNLTPSTPYYFESYASNGIFPRQTSVVSAPISTAATPSGDVLKNQMLITFLIKDVTTGIWQVNTSGNADIGSMFLTGAQAGTIVSGSGSGLPSQATSISNMLAFKALGGGTTPLMISMGGATGNLGIMMPTVQSAQDLCNSIWNSLFGAAAPNPLSWSNAAWGGGPTPLFFDGMDLDWENAMGGDVALAFLTQWSANVTAYGGAVGKKYLNMAPQSPNTWYPSDSSFPWTNGGANVPWAGSQSALSTIHPGFLASPALLAPAQLKVFDNIFIQLYNQAGLYLTEPPGSTTYNPNFTAQIAQWAYLVMKARRAGGSTVLTWGFASTDAPQIWGQTDGAILNTAIGLINAQVSAQLIADGDAPCAAYEWSGGFGMWNSPTNINPITFVYGSTSAITKADMSAQYATFYMSATYPSPATLWAAPIPLTDTRAV